MSPGSWLYSVKHLFCCGPTNHPRRGSSQNPPALTQLLPEAPHFTPSPEGKSRPLVNPGFSGSSQNETLGLRDPNLRAGTKWWVLLLPLDCTWPAGRRRKLPGDGGTASHPRIHPTQDPGDSPHQGRRDGGGAELPSPKPPSGLDGDLVPPSPSQPSAACGALSSSQAQGHPDSLWDPGIRAIPQIPTQLQAQPHSSLPPPSSNLGIPSKFPRGGH